RAGPPEAPEIAQVAVEMRLYQRRGDRGVRAIVVRNRLAPERGLGAQAEARTGGLGDVDEEEGKHLVRLLVLQKSAYGLLQIKRRHIPEADTKPLQKPLPLHLYSNPVCFSKPLYFQYTIASKNILS